MLYKEYRIRNTGHMSCESGHIIITLYLVHTLNYLGTADHNVTIQHHYNEFSFVSSSS